MNKISLEIALKFTEKFQREYPKRDLHELTEELANEIDKVIQVEEKCLFCNKETTIDDMKYKDGRVCQKCTDTAMANYFNYSEQ